MSWWLIASLSLIAGAVVCRLVSRIAVRAAPEKLVRTNVDGKTVPAVLGWGVTAGMVVGFSAALVGTYLAHVERYRCEPPAEVCPLNLVTFDLRPFVGIVIVVVGFFAVGLWDDAKGAERPRGFRGHLGSARSGVWTGGLVKLVGGSFVGLVGTAFLEVDELLLFLGVAACTALGANLINLFDRAPGRAIKVFLVLALPLAVLGAPGLGAYLAGPIGASVAGLPMDLKAKAMLGDSGANPVGAVLGFALVAQIVWSFQEIGLYVLVVVLLALNLVSERWSFSEVIANNRLLARLDQLGRK